jgi:prolyl-tRNA synthetase
VFAARRDTRAKQSLPMDGLAARVTSLLDEIQAALFDRARAFRDSHTSATTSYEEFKSTMDGRPGFVQAPWCGSAKCEADIKAETQATIRNIPFGFEKAPGVPCIKCNGDAIVTAWFAKAY